MNAYRIGAQWYGIHLFFPAGIYSPWCDRVVSNIVRPFAIRCETCGWADQWFFIRYTEHGPHIRFRFRATPRSFDRELRPALEDLLRIHNPGILERSGTNLAESLTAASRDPAGPLVRSFAWIDYVPETERYGGTLGVDLAERFFQKSSEFAASVVPEPSNDSRGPRLGRALLAMLVATHAFFANSNGVAQFARYFATAYLRTIGDEDDQARLSDRFANGFDRQAEMLTQYVSEAWDRLQSGEELTPELDPYRYACRQLADDFRRLHSNAGFVGIAGSTLQHAILRILPSYVHMTNNRLGISVTDEAYLAHLIQRALSPIVVATTDANR